MPRRAPADSSSVSVQPGVPSVRILADDATRHAAPETRLPASPPFLLRWHPARWHAVPGADQTWLLCPSLAKLTLQPGVSNVKLLRSGVFDVREAIHQAQLRGWRIIPTDVDGPGTSYLHEPVVGSYLTRFEAVYPGCTEPVPDTEAYTAWVLSLVERGVIDPIGPATLAKLQERYAAELRAAEDAIGADRRPSAVEAAAAARGRLACIETARRAGRAA
jgi:hypothetical protein